MQRMSTKEARKKSPLVGPKEHFHPCHLAARLHPDTRRHSSNWFATSVGAPSVPFSHLFVPLPLFPSRKKPKYPSTAPLVLIPGKHPILRPRRSITAERKCRLFSSLVHTCIRREQRIEASSMDTICFDDWEVLPDQASSFSMEECGNGHGGVGGKDQLLLGAEVVMVDMDHFAATASHRSPYDWVLDEDAKQPLLEPSPDVHEHVPVTEFKDIGVVHTELKRAASMSKVTEILISDAEGEEEVIEFPDGVKEVVQDDEVLAEAADEPDHNQFAGEDEEGAKKIGFSVGNLRVHGAGALYSFGVAAATFCIFLLGGKQQQERRSQNHKIHLQMCADEYDQRIQRAMQQASRLNQTMSSVMGGASTPRASISFGGHYHGF